MNSLDRIFIYLCFVLAFFSFLCSVLVVFAHFKVPQLRKHPGQMIVTLCILQIMLDTHWLTASESLRENSEDIEKCQVLGIFYSILIFLSWNTLTSLAVELVIKIKSPLKTNYLIRGKIYFILSVLMTAFETSLIAILGEFGFSDLETCFIKSRTHGNYVCLIVIAVNIPIIVISTIVLSKSGVHGKNKALRRHIFVISSQCFLQGVPLIIITTQNSFDKVWVILDYISLLFGTASGIILAVCRLGSTEIIKRIWFSVFTKKAKENNKFSMQALNLFLIEETSVSNLFSDITDKNTRDILLNVSMYLLSTETSDEKSCSYSKRKFFFKESDFFKLKQYISISNFYLEKNGIWSYSDELFDKIRSSCNVLKRDILMSLCTDQNLEILSNKNEGGRSDAFIFESHDEKFIIKTLTKQERYVLLELLPAYIKRISNYPDSRLVRILGLFKLTSTKLTIILMENIIKSRSKAKIFDLKGSLDDRYVPTKDPRKTVYKDRNFLESDQIISLDIEVRNNIVSSLYKDIKFLRKFNIIDYSLLVGIYPSYPSHSSRYLLKGSIEHGYSLGIIDFLQQYTVSKKFELCIKRIKGKKNTSVCSANKYYTRFHDFIKRIFL